MLRKLQDHQVLALKYMLFQRHCALFMQPRMRKTLVVVRRVKLDSRARLALVVVPNEALQTWPDELTQEGETFHVIEGTTEVKKAKLKRALLDASFGKRVWVIVSDTLHRYVKEYAEWAWDWVILDEATFLKNPSSGVSRFYCSRFRGARHRVCMTGTPAPQHDLEYFPIMKFLFGGMLGFKDYYHFRNEMFIREHFYFRPTWKFKKMLAEFLKRTCFVMGYDAIGHTHNEREHFYYPEMPEKLRREYDHAETHFECGERSTIWATQAYIWLSFLASGYLPVEDEPGQYYLASPFKLMCLRELADSLGRVPLVIICDKTQEIRDICEEFPDAHAVYGDDDRPTRAETIKRFQRGEFNTIVCQHRCVSMGNDLSRAQHMIFYSLSGSIKSYLQVKKRTLTLETKELDYHYICAKDTVSEDIFTALTERAQSVSAFLESKIVERRMKRGK